MSRTDCASILLTVDCDNRVLSIEDGSPPPLQTFEVVVDADPVRPELARVEPSRVQLLDTSGARCVAVMNTVKKHVGSFVMLLLMGMYAIDDCKGRLRRTSRSNKNPMFRNWSWLLSRSASNANFTILGVILGHESASKLMDSVRVHRNEAAASAASGGRRGPPSYIDPSDTSSNSTNIVQQLLTEIIIISIDRVSYKDAARAEVVTRWLRLYAYDRVFPDETVMTADQLFLHAKLQPLLLFLGGFIFKSSYIMTESRLYTCYILPLSQLSSIMGLESFVENKRACVTRSPKFSGIFDVLENQGGGKRSKITHKFHECSPSLYMHYLAETFFDLKHCFELNFVELDVHIYVPQDAFLD